MLNRESSRDTKGRIRILFSIWADADNTNAQSLNARDIALRLNPKRFESYLFARRPDPRLLNKESIHLIHLPPRLRSLVVACHLVWGDYDILFYPPHNLLMTWYRALVWTGKRKKIIATVEGTAQQIQAVPSATRKRLLRLLFEADTCCALSPYIADTMQQEFGLRTKVVPIGVDTAVFTPVDRADHRPPIKVLCVGSLQPRKQIHLILDLAQRIGPTEAEFHIIGDVIGSPAYRDSLLERKAKERLDHVYFHGGMPQRGVAQWMQRCDVFVLPSRLEGTPKVTYEAAATGLPCIIFNDYQTPSVVDGVTGFQVKTFEEMLDRLRLLIEDRDLRLQMGMAAREHAKNFDWDVVVKQWERVFEDVVRNG